MVRKQGLQLRPKLISIAVASCFVTSSALANPTGPTVVHGSATFQQAANLLKITNSPNAIINWQSFSIGANEITRFIQQSQSSAVLNRVTGNGGVIDPSVILGALQSNGRVYLINPSGILFGAGAQIDVGGLVASSLNLSNADFLANRLKFTDVPGAGSVINQGTITTPSGGNVYLVGAAVTNSGIITSPQGEVVLAAGNSVELVSPGTPNLRVEVNAQDEEARNLGQILAESGRIGIYAGLINHSGSLRADTVEVGKNGEILLVAKKNIVLEPGSVISASGAPGGVHDGGTVRIVAEDTLDMRRDSAVHVDGGIDGGNGGFLELSGRQQIALNGEFTGRARKDGYKNGSLLIDPANINIGANGLIATLALPALGGGVGKMLVTTDGARAYIMRPEFSSSSTYIDVVDLGSNTIITSILITSGVGQTLTDIAFSPDGLRLYALGVNATPASIFVIDTNPANTGTYNTVIQTFSAGSLNTNPRAIAVSPDGSKLYTAHQNFVCSTCAAPPSRISVINAADGTQGPADFVEVSGFPTQLLTNPVSQRLYVFNQGQLQEIDTTTNTLLGSTPISGSPRSMVLSADSSLLYLPFAGRVEVRNSSTKALLGTLPFGADALAVNSSGTLAYITGNGSVSIADLGTSSVIQTFATGGTGNSAVGFAAGSNRVYATTTGTNSLAVVDLSVGGDATTGGAIAYNASPGATLSVPVSALNGAWSAVDLAASNNVNVNAPILSGNLDPGTTLFKLSAGNDVNINASMGSSVARHNRDITLRAGNTVNIHGSIYQSVGRTLALDANVTDALYGMTASGVGSVNIKALGAPITIDTQGSLLVTGRDFNILGGVNTPVTVNVGGLLDANITGNALIQAGRARAEAGDTVNSSVAVTANAVSIVAAGNITIAAGDNGFANAEGPGNNAANATANTSLTSATTLALNAGGVLTIRGGDNNSAYATNGNNTATMNAGTVVSAGTGMTLSGSSIMIRGGDDASAYASGGNNTATVTTNVSLVAGGALTLMAAGNIDIRGGDNASGTAGSGGLNTVTVNTNATVQAASITLTGGAVTVRGGDFGSASAWGPEISNSATVNTNADVHATGNITVNASSLTVRGGNSNNASASYSGTHVAALNANASLRADGAMTLNITGPVLIAGGDFNSASASSGKNTATLNANATMSAGTNLGVTATGLTVRGGNSNDASASSNGTNIANLNANASLTAGQAMTLAISGPVLIAGGDFNSASASSGKNTATLNANATVSAGATLTLTNATSLTVRGGNANSASASDGGTNVATLNANASLLANSMNLTVAGPVSIRGGTSAEASASWGVGNNTATLNANALVRATNDLTLTVTTGDLAVAGGSAAASASEVNGVARAAANANAELSAGGNLTINVQSGNLTVRGGWAGATVSASSAAADGMAQASAKGRIGSGGNMNISVSGSLAVQGGDFASASASAFSGAGTKSVATANVDATIAAGGSLTVTANNISVRGGAGPWVGASGDGQNTASVTARGELTAGTTLALTAPGGISVGGGAEARALASSGSAAAVNIALADLGALVSAPGNIIINAGNLTVSGGVQGASSGFATASGLGVNTATTRANAAIIGGADFVYTGGVLLLSGGTARSFGGVGNNAAIAEANTAVQSAGTQTMNVAGLMLIQGGAALDDALAPNLGGAMANVTLDAGAQINATATGNITFGGGSFSGVGVSDVAIASPVVTFSGANVGQGARSNITGLVNATASGTISLAQPADFNLGLLQAGSGISVTSSAGTIIDGNAGLNIVAPSASLLGMNGVGSVGNPLETQVSALGVSANGGEIGIINSGDLQLSGVTFTGTQAQVGTTGILTTLGPITAPSGNVTLTANNGMVIDQFVTVGGDLTLNAGAGDLGVSGVDVTATNITLSGNNIFIGFSTTPTMTGVIASNQVTGTSAGNFNVIGGSTPTAHSLLEGLNVNLTVGTTSGSLNLVTGSNGASAEISSISPTTITLNFPNLLSGGYFVDGVEGATINGSTGFIAAGMPAVLGQNLVVSYGSAPPPPPGGGVPTEEASPLNAPINEVITTVNNQGDEKKDPEPETNSATVLTESDERKKDAAVCR